MSPPGLLRRDDLLAALDRAATRKVTIISAPPGSGKTSLLRAWADRSSEDRRVAFVSVPRDQQDAQQFWLAVLDAIRQSATTTDSRAQPAAPAFDGDAVIETIVSELAEQAKVVVLIIDDLHELSSADARAVSNACWPSYRGRPTPYCRLAAIRRSACTSCGWPARSRRSAPATCSSARTRPASCCERPASRCLRMA